MLTHSSLDYDPSNGASMLLPKNVTGLTRHTPGVPAQGTTSFHYRECYRSRSSAQRSMWLTLLLRDMAWLIE